MDVDDSWKGGGGEERREKEREREVNETVSNGLIYRIVILQISGLKGRQSLLSIPLKVRQKVKNVTTSKLVKGHPLHRQTEQNIKLNATPLACRIVSLLREYFARA